jgi:hypothetical protein
MPPASSPVIGIGLIARTWTRAPPPGVIRDCVLTADAADRPENIRAWARLLGHRDLRTAEDHFNHATAASLGRRHFQVINNLRQRHAGEMGEEDA